MFTVMSTHNEETAERFKAPKDHFDCAGLIYLCDADVIYKSAIQGGQCDVSEVYFFLRTLKHNLVVTDKNTKGILFDTHDYMNHKDIPNGMSLNDYMLLCAKDLLMHLYSTNGDIYSFAFNCMPTPFGLIDYKDKNIAVFQLVCNTEGLPPLKPQYAYTEVDHFIVTSELSRKVVNQFKRTNDKE